MRFSLLAPLLLCFCLFLSLNTSFASASSAIKQRNQIDQHNITAQIYHNLNDKASMSAKLKRRFVIVDTTNTATSPMSSSKTDPLLALVIFVALSSLMF